MWVGNKSSQFCKAKAVAAKTVMPISRWKPATQLPGSPKISQNHVFIILPKKKNNNFVVLGHLPYWFCEPRINRKGAAFSHSSQQREMGCPPSKKPEPEIMPMHASLSLKCDEDHPLKSRPAKAQQSITISLLSLPSKIWKSIPLSLILPVHAHTSMDSTAWLTAMSLFFRTLPHLYTS